LKKLIFFLIILFNGFLICQTDSIFVEVINNTAIIHHNQNFQNCASKFQINLNLNDSYIEIIEVDTVGPIANCMCYFDLSATITNLVPGEYLAEIFSTVDTTIFTGTIHDTIPHGTVTFIIEENSTTDPGYINSTDSGCLTDPVKSTDEEIEMISHTNSGCLGENSKGDSSYISVSTYGHEMVLFWHALELNCCLEPTWTGFLTNDTFHVAMIDTGMPCDCLCPFNLSVTFGSFESGIYVLDFLDGILGYPNFTIGSNISINVNEDMMTLTWDIADLNCCYLPNWQGYLSNDTFFVELTNATIPCYCLCPYHLTSTYGPFESGNYFLNFNYCDDIMNFHVENRKGRGSPVILNQYQSECYSIVAIDNDPVTDSDNFLLLPPYPNPFNSSTIIKFNIPEKTQISLKIYNIKGNLVDVLLDQVIFSGTNSIQWNGQNIPSGIYFIHLVTDKGIQTQKILLLK